MYNFILGQWILGKFTNSQVQNCTIKGYISQNEASIILATPKAV